MTTKLITLNIPTVGNLEFFADDEFVADLNELEVLRAKAIYDDEFWGVNDCE